MKEFDRINVVYGFATSFLAAIFGKYWFLFAGFFLLNVVDYGSGYIKSKYFLKNASSAVGAKGIAKKVMYWVVIGVAFFVAGCFEKVGIAFKMDLSFLYLLGYFTLGTYIINEIRSILENCVVIGIKVPKFLTRGLDIAEKLIEEQTKEISEQE